MTAAGERCKKQGSSIGKVSPLWQTLLLLVRGASRLSDTRGKKLEREKTAGDGDEKAASCCPRGEVGRREAAVQGCMRRRARTRKKKKRALKDRTRLQKQTEEREARAQKREEGKGGGGPRGTPLPFFPF